MSSKSISNFSMSDILQAILDSSVEVIMNDTNKNIMAAEISRLKIPRYYRTSNINGNTTSDSRSHRFHFFKKDDNKEHLDYESYKVDSRDNYYVALVGHFSEKKFKILVTDIDGLSILKLALDILCNVGDIHQNV